MKKMFAVSIITAFIAASLSAFSVFAAPSAPSRTWGSQFGEVQSDRAFYDHFKADHKNFVNVSDPIKLQRYLSDYAVALSKAEALVANRGLAAATDTKNMSNAQINSQNQVHQTAEQNLAMYLHIMRDLKNKLSAL